MDWRVLIPIGRVGVIQLSFWTARTNETDAQSFKPNLFGYSCSSSWCGNLEVVRSEA